MKKKVFLLALASFVLFGANSAFCMKKKNKGKHHCINVKGERGWYSSRSDIEKYDKSFKKKIDEGKGVEEAIEEVMSEADVKDEPRIFWVCRAGSAVMLKELLTRVKKEEITAFYEFKTVSVINYVLQGDTIRDITNHKKTLLYIAVEADRTDVVKLLVPHFKNSKAINLESEVRRKERSYILGQPIYEKMVTTKMTVADIAVMRRNKKTLELLEKNGVPVKEKLEEVEKLRDEFFRDIE